MRQILAALSLLLTAITASAQPGIKVSQVDPSGKLSSFTFDPSSNANAKAPTPGPNNTFKYWDGLSASNYYLVPNYTTSPPNPQIAVGPDDILTVVNRTIARYPNPNAAGNTGAANPYSYPPTHAAFLDAWIGILGGSAGNPSFNPAGLCPSRADSATCLLDNVSIRYDQMQGRFVVLATVTDLEAHLSNWVLLISRWANFACSTTVTPNPPSACAGTSDLFTPPVVPVVGGPAVGGFNGNWIGYIIPINVFIPTGGLTRDLITAGAPFCPNGGNPATMPPGGGTQNFNFGPGNPAFTPTTGCTNYYPTAARFGLDNDNIILTAPVLDQTQAVFAPSGGAGLPGGAFAGTRITTVPKLIVYNGTALPLSGGSPFPPPFGVGLGAVNLADSSLTGTLTVFLNLGPPAPGLLFPTGPLSNPLVGSPLSAIPGIFWEPDNLRGRALASFDSQVGVSSSAGPINTNVQGVITPIDYLVGVLIGDVPGGDAFNSQNAAYGSNFIVQPIVFSCPATAIFSSNSGVTFCGTSGGAGTQVPELPALGVYSTGQSLPRATALALVPYGDPQLVGQGPATSSPPPVLGPSGLAGIVQGQPRMFVGDSRPQQVIFREGLLYMARAATTFDLNFNTLNTSTVVYDILKQAGPACQTNALLGLGGPGPFCVAAPTGICPSPTGAGCAASPYSPNGITIPNPVTILESQWYNGTTPPLCSAVPGISGPVSGAGNTPGNSTEPVCDSNGYGFYAPMFDVPANVIGGLATSANQPISPISLFPWLEKLFVGMTTGGTSNLNGTFATNNPSLWDFRPGDDAYDSSLPYIDPVNGRHKSTTNDPFLCNLFSQTLFFSPDATCPVIPFGTRGGASTDPNDGSLWLYGSFAKKRFSQVQTGPGVWGTSVANYALDFPLSDPYNNDNSYFTDVQPGTNQFFTWIQISKNVGIGFPKPGVCTTGGTQGNPNPPNPPIIPPSTGNSAGTSTGSAGLACNAFGPTDLVSRSEMAKWIVLSQMDEAQVTAYLLATGGVPGCAIAGTTSTTKGNTTLYPGAPALTCGNNAGGFTTASSFGDGPCTGATGAVPCPANSVPIPGISGTGYPGIFDDPNLRYIEVMKRRGYTKGCFNTTAVSLTFCPTQAVTRGEMAVFVIRAKMNNVFPTTLSGVPLQSPYGDNFGSFLAANPNAVPGAAAPGVYFSDEPNTDQFFIYIQKMRELRITNGRTATTYDPNSSIQRQEVATFVVRTFFL